MKNENELSEQSPDLGQIGKCRIVGRFQDTRINNEHFAITPYFFGVWIIGETIKIRGLGICWGYYSVFLGIGWNLPKYYRSFSVWLKKANKPT